MTTPSNSMPNSFPAQSAAHNSVPTPPDSPTRPFYWSVRRELWENRSIYIAPLAVAAVTLVGFVIATLGRALSTSDIAHRRAILESHFNFVSALIMGTTFVVGIFYSLDALHSERRDRSILFWKSLPVSDLTTVLSKASIPLLVLPAITVILTVAMLWIMLLLSSLVLVGSGLNAATLWSQSPLLQISLLLLYHLITVHILWHAPFYAWMLLVSAWARRAVFLWAALPIAAIGILEKIVFNTRRFANFLEYRLSGPEPYNLGAPSNSMSQGHSMSPGLSANSSHAANSIAQGAHSMHTMSTVDPAKFLTTPVLWLGLIVTAALLAATVHLRRSQSPL